MKYSTRKHNLAIAIVLYRPNAFALQNIELALKMVDVVYVFDNTPNAPINLSDIQGGERCNYHWAGDNKGIAFALNHMLRLADAAGFKWLVTMDQDSRYDQESFDLMRDHLAKFAGNDKSSVAILAPMHVKSNEVGLSAKKVVITSGSFVNIACALQIGGWNEDLYLDAVDYDFCLRLGSDGLRIVQVKHAVLQHNLGTPLEISLSIFKLKTYAHNPIRTYYCFRNGFYIIRAHAGFWPGLVPFLLWGMVKDIVRIFFSNNRLAHFEAIKRAILDFNGNRMGRYSGLDPNIL